MRFRLLVLALMVWPLSGAVCIAPPPGTNPSTVPTTALGATFTAPTTDRTVPRGLLVSVKWQATNTTGETALLEVYVENRTSLAKITLASNVSIGGTTLSGTLEWDTSAAVAGDYSIRARIATSTQSRDATAGGRITIDGAATFVFTQPSADTTVRQPDGTMNVAWTTNDKEGGGHFRIGLDPDLDHGSGNEIIILQRDLMADVRNDSFSWSGDDTSNAAVAAGTYNLFALVEDGVNALVTAEGLAHVIVEAQDQNQNVSLGVRQPSADIEVIPGGPPQTIEFGVNQSDDVLIDLKLDQDDVHTNGNEITILSQRLVRANTRTDTFAWNGVDTAGVVVPSGIYKLVLFSSRGSGTPQVVESTHFVFRRAVAATADSRQTWEFSGTSWTVVQPTDRPSARRAAAAVYDQVANVTTLFGGQVTGAANAETWTYNRTNWQQLSLTPPSPSARFGHALIFDSSLNFVVLFGGTNGTTPNAETWTLNGTAWSQEAAAGPSARFFHAMAFDSGAAVTWLFGGTNGTTRNNEIWSYDGTVWFQANPPSAPSAREGAAMAYELTRHATILFGGQDASGVTRETWEWDGSAWTLHNPATNPPARRGHALAYNVARSKIVMFGGTDGVVALNDTWEWNGTNWLLIESPSVPPAREGHALSYDNVGARLVLFGGASGLPVISLTGPTANQTVDPGAFISIAWRDDDPTDGATLRLTVDDDANPAEATETNNPELEILSGREARFDGVQDTFAWQVPLALQPGTYFIFAYIDRDGMPPFDNHSVAAGKLVIRNPAGPQ